MLSGTHKGRSLTVTPQASIEIFYFLSAPRCSGRQRHAAAGTHSRLGRHRPYIPRLDQFGDLLAQLSLVGSAHRVYDLAALVEQEGGHARDPQLCREPAKLVHVHLHSAAHGNQSMSPPIPGEAAGVPMRVHLDKDGGVAVLLCQRLKRWRYPLARPTPDGREI